MAAQPHLLAFKQPICTYRLVLRLIMRVLSAIEQFLEDDNDVPIGRKRHGVATLLLPSYDPRTLKDQRCSYVSSTPAACKQGSSQGHARVCACRLLGDDRRLARDVGYMEFLLL